MIGRSSITNFLTNGRVMCSLLKWPVVLASASVPGDSPVLDSAAGTLTRWAALKNSAYSQLRVLLTPPLFIFCRKFCNRNWHNTQMEHFFFSSRGVITSFRYINFYIQKSCAIFPINHNLNHKRAQERSKVKWLALVLVYFARLNASY
jgi:hypothetical protein